METNLPEPKIKIFVADDHQLVREGLVALLETVDHFDLIGTAVNGQDLVHQLRFGVKPHVVLADHDMPQLTGLEALQIIKKDFIGIKFILLTMMQSRELIESCLQHDVDGFLYKNSSLDELVTAITMVARGQKYFTGEVTMALAHKNPVSANPELTKLSEREIEILKLVAKGLSSTSIGHQLYISPRTVDTHRNNIIQKLEVNGIAGLTQFAIKNKLI
ncbi:MAG: response regulator transcription factor [Saprospiraceae bacterium]|jgi:DNA-binding NarL/FixJ family response regulator|nr:response regulator transcription factor [Saprospiraceae bacterium]MBK8512828.1 response regulator transcription factor [Saprospiraceae bacterium]MBK9931412.1 response regulator transcription factor [Saprospiraceae bacterium]MBP8094994.1 response regulator transcription factor [Saprospiraceae bacterium]